MSQTILCIIRFAVAIVLLSCVMHQLSLAQVAEATANARALTVSVVGTTQIQLTGSVDTGTKTFTIRETGCGDCTNPAHGTLSDFNSNGLVKYTPHSGYTGQDTFTFQTVKNGAVFSTSATITITVSNAKTPVTSKLTDGAGNALTGLVTFVLVAPTDTPSGLTPISPSVSANLTAGIFNAALYPSVSLSPQAYYNLWHYAPGSVAGSFIGLYSIPMQTAKLDLRGCDDCQIEDANLIAKYTIASSAQVNNVLSLARQSDIKLNGVLVGTRGTLNFINGANIANSVAENSGSGAVDITISGPLSSMGGGTVLTGTVGRLAKYSSATGVDSLALGNTFQLLRVNAAGNSYEHATLTEGTAIDITNTSGVATIAVDTTAVTTTLNGQAGAQTFAINTGACGPNFTINSSGGTHNICRPDAAIDRTGDMNVSYQTIGGAKTFTGTIDTHIPITVIQDVDGENVLQHWKDSAGTYAGTISVYGGHSRRFNVGIGATFPLNDLNNGWVMKVIDSSSNLGTDPAGAQLNNFAYTGGTTAGNIYGGYNNVTITATSAVTSSFSTAGRDILTVNGSGNVTAGAASRSELSKANTSTWSTAYGHAFTADVSGGTITTLPYIYITAPTASGGGAITNLRGIEIEDMTLGATSNYAIKTGRGLVSLGDAIEVAGITAPGVSVAGRSKFYHDSASNLLMLSQNGGNFAPVDSWLTGSASLNFPSVSANSCSSALTITVTGAVDGKPVRLGVPTASASTGIAYQAWVSAANTVSIVACNPTGSPIDPAVGVFSVRVSL